MQLTCYRNDILAIYNTMNHLNSAISVDVLNVAGSEALESSDRSLCCMFNFQKETRKLPVLDGAQKRRGRRQTSSRLFGRVR